MNNEIGIVTEMNWFRLQEIIELVALKSNLQFASVTTYRVEIGEHLDYEDKEKIHMFINGPDDDLSYLYNSQQLESIYKLVEHPKWYFIEFDEVPLFKILIDALEKESKVFIEYDFGELINKDEFFRQIGLKYYMV
jgi:hypothetical protein